MIRVINLFGGPGTGKSTLAADVFAEMKRRGMSVELVTEFAKDLVWEDATSTFADQLYILGNQNRRITRLIGKVDWVVSDSPLLMNLAYAPKYYLPDSYETLIRELFNMYHNHNFLLPRVFEYQRSGRNQTETIAKAVDSTISTILNETGTRYHLVDSTDRKKFILDAIQSNKQYEVLH